MQWLVIVAAVNVAQAAAANDAADETKPSDSSAVSYARDVLPLLRQRCQGCHQPARSEGGVDLTSLAGMTAESESGSTIIVPGDPSASGLIEQITPDESGAALMPMDGEPLSAEQVTILTRWIAEGATLDVTSDRPRYDQEHPPEYLRPASITGLDASPDGSLIAVSGLNETLLIDAHSARRGEQRVMHRLIGMSERIESVKFSPDGTRLAVAGGTPGEAGELQVWDVAEGSLIVSHSATADTLRGVAWSHDGSRVAFGGADTNLYVIDATTGEQVMEQGAHSDWVLAAAFSLDGKYVISGSRDQTIKLTETESGRFVDNITAVSPNVPAEQILAIARDAARDLIAVGGSAGVPRTYMVHRVVERKIGDDSNMVRMYPAMPGRIFSVAFSRDGTRLAAVASDAASGRLEVFAVPDAVQPPEDVKLIQGKVVTERSAEEKARLDAYHREGAIRLAYGSGDMGPLYAVAFTTDGEAVVTGGADGLVRFHDAKTGVLLADVSPFPTPATGQSKQGPQIADVEHGGAPAVEFLTDVMPILGKLGCNAGTCHGSRAGKNGFQLSLRGYDPWGDFRALTDDLSGRRINRTNPEASLMLLKPAGGVAHGGGVLAEPGSRRYEVLRQWIAQGARYNPEAPRVVRIELEPANPVLQRAGETIAMRVTAQYSDGSTRDVTADAFIESGDTESAVSDAAGKVSAVRRGEAPLLARFEGSYAATTLTVMGDRDEFEWKPAPVYNHIDELVDAKLQRMKINPSGLTTDEQFLRRVHLDLTGLPPTAGEVRDFAEDDRPSQLKRSEVIDNLIGNEDFIEHWTNKWADLLMVNSRFLGAEGAAAYRQWIRTAVADNWPYDKFAREIFTASGSNREHPAASYYKVLRTPEMIAETSTQIFLGVRFNCNKCHDHPFERWTQDDYYGWAAYFANLRLSEDPASSGRKIAGSAVEEAQPLYEIVDDLSEAHVIHERTGKPADPHFPFPAAADGPPGDVLRHEAAHWLTTADNRYFASSYVNRVWAQLMGVGLIEPVDDIRAGNPPTNPELLDWLTQEFVAGGFDVQKLIRTICQSRTYQLSSETNRWNADDGRNYSHALPRRLSAEALYDAVHRSVGSVSRFPGMPPGTRAAALPDSMIELESGLLSKLGRPARESGCECERSSELQLGPVMALLNGPTFADAIDDPSSELAQLEQQLSDDKQLAEEVFLRVLGRRPTAEEQRRAVALLSAPADERALAAEAAAARRERLAPGFDAWRETNRPVAWTVLKPLQVSGTMSGTLEISPDNSVFAPDASGKGTYRVVLDVPTQEVRGLRLEVLADDRLPSKGPGRAPNGNFVINQIRVFTLDATTSDEPRRVKIRSSEADFNQNGYNVSGAIDAKRKTGWAVAGAPGVDHAAVFGLARPIRNEGSTQLVIELDQLYDDDHLVGRFRISATVSGGALMPPTHDEPWSSLLAAESLDQKDLQQLRKYYYSLDKEYRELRRAEQLLANPRRSAVQDLAWALINSPAFLFNH